MTPTESFGSRGRDQLVTTISNCLHVAGSNVSSGPN